MDSATLTNHIKDELITQYLRQHPGLSKSDVVTKCRNGQLVTDSVANLFKDMNLREKVKDAHKNQQDLINQHLDEYFTVDPSERYKAATESVGHSKKLINFLFQSTKLPFGLREKKENLDYLHKRERICANSARDAIHCREQLANLLDDDVCTNSLVKTLVCQLLNSGAAQLKSQAAIYNKEVELGNFYSDKVKNLIKDFATAIKTKSDQQTKLLIRDVYAFLLKNEMGKLDLTKINEGELNAALSRFESKLDKRSKQVLAIQAVVMMIEKIVAELEAEQEAAKPKKEDKPASSGNRMAFAKKLMSKFGF
ncbi:MAG: hypothetical protein GC154_02650 [bacterium]|nr:hypothetical protein [bacterium]